jgi:hypothetical protein
MNGSGDESGIGIESNFGGFCASKCNGCGKK